jgi:hypothetical protein
VDGGNRSVDRPGYAQMIVRIPVELKYLVEWYKNTTRMPSFNYAVRHLLETHPEIARMAAELVQSGKDSDGLDTHS